MPRPKGSVNRNRTGLLAQLKVIYGKDFHPILRMAENAHNAQTIVNNNEDEDCHFDLLCRANDMWSKIAEYTAPKLKAVEHTGVDGEPLAVRVVDYATHNS